MMNNYETLHKNSIEYILSTTRNKLQKDNIDSTIAEECLQKYKACISNCISKEGILYLTPQTLHRVEQVKNVDLHITSHLDITPEYNTSECTKLFSLEPYNTQINNIVLQALWSCDIVRLLDSKNHNPLDIATSSFPTDLNKYINDNILTCKPLAEEFYIRLNELVIWIMMLLDYYIIILDTETCGLEDLRPVQVSCVVTDINMTNIIDTFNVYIKQTNIPKEAVDIHGLSEELLSNIGVSQEEGVELFQNFLQKYSDKALFVGHNLLHFDIKVIELMRKMSGKSLSIQHTFDTYRNRKLVISSLPNKPDKNSLTAYLECANITSEEINKEVVKLFDTTSLQQHNAIFDVVALFKLLNKLEFMRFNQILKI